MNVSKSEYKGSLDTKQASLITEIGSKRNLIGVLLHNLNFDT